MPTQDGGTTLAAKDADRSAAFPAVLAVTLAGVMAGVLNETYAHLGDVLISSNVYAPYARMSAFCTSLGLVGLGWRGALDQTSKWSVIAYSGVGLMLVVIAETALWGMLPDYFASFQQYPFSQTFAEREAVRLCVYTAMVLPPGLLLGLLCIASMTECAESTAGGAGLGDSLAVAVFALAMTAGDNVAAKVVIPWLGGFYSLGLLVALGAGVTLLGALVERARVPRALGGSAIIFAACCAVLLPRFDPTQLSRGTAVYFDDPKWGHVVGVAENAADGLIAIVQQRGGRGTESTLLVNGTPEEGENANAALAALDGATRTRGRDRALVVGFGTGEAPHACALAGFSAVDVSEASLDLVRLARSQFHYGSESSGNSVVSIHKSSARSVLTESRWRYDVIALPESNLAARRVSSVQSQDFYSLAQSRLTDDGVLSQAIRLTRTTSLDVLRAVATVRSVFPYVTLAVHDDQGDIIACSKPCPFIVDVAETVAAEASVSPLRYRKHLPELGADVFLDSTGVDDLLATLAQGGVRADALVSTDENQRLEYEMPRSIHLEPATSFERVLRALRRPDAVLVN
jgi:spermidine synthase